MSWTGGILDSRFPLDSNVTFYNFESSLIVGKADFSNISAVSTQNEKRVACEINQQLGILNHWMFFFDSLDLEWGG